MRRWTPDDRRVAITFVTVGELTQWTYLHRWDRSAEPALEHSSPASSSSPPATRAATVWGEIQAHARLRGRPRPINDSWVAACCLARGLPLATLNFKDNADFAENDSLELLR